MDKYSILIILNVPFVIFGLIKTYTMYKNDSIKRWGLIVRVLFWLVILGGLIFAEEIYGFLNSSQLTDTAPLSLADVALVTGINFCLFLSLQLYSRVDLVEKRLSDLQEKISIDLFEKK